MAWVELNEENQFSKEILASNTGRHLIFKHSPRCGISSFALKGFERSSYFKSSNDSLWILNVLESRNLSLQIAKDMNIQHESPQILVFSNGKVIHHASHSSIDADLIQEMS
ncbi:MAG: bacillithiol system redox-active protein YtxJ [Crocinitomicaceae bacterium]|nr:bacillithiol system redox-active protein YtxJ [Crocinitomicaceae bacterium]